MSEPLVTEHLRPEIARDSLRGRLTSVFLPSLGRCSLYARQVELTPAERSVAASTEAPPPDAARAAAAAKVPRNTPREWRGGAVASTVAVSSCGSLSHQGVDHEEAAVNGGRGMEARVTTAWVRWRAVRAAAVSMGTLQEVV